MQIKFAIGSALALAVLAAGAAISQDAARNASDGVYTAEQAKRGQASFAANCAVCHGDDMSGSESGPSLSGTDFTLAWKGHNAEEIVDLIQKKMPSNSPGILSRQQSADITAYILSVNKYPTGAAEMPSNADSLQQIVIDAVKAAK